VYQHPGFELQKNAQAVFGTSAQTAAKPKIESEKQADWSAAVAV
jgi:hypothetical protein